MAEFEQKYFTGRQLARSRSRRKRLPENMRYHARLSSRQLTTARKTKTCSMRNGLAKALGSRRLGGTSGHTRRATLVPTYESLRNGVATVATGNYPRPEGPIMSAQAVRPG